jgi:uncharacterized protein (DUF2336 family)
MGAPLALIRELDNTIEHASDIRRAAMLRHLTDLYLVGVDEFSDDEIAVVDDVFVRLVATIEESSRALLAIRIAPVAKAPPKVVRILACDDAIEVASPVLSQSERLDTATLVECATTKSQEHLLAISRRRVLPEAVTDVLVERGDQQIVLSTARNRGARFSSRGFGILVKRSSGDDQLASCVGMRPDLPPQLFDQLLAAASEAVRAKLTAEKDHNKGDIARIVEDVTERIQARATITQSPVFAAAQVLIESLNEAKQLTTAKLDDFAKTGRFEEIVAALSVMANTPADVVERTVNDSNAESILVLAKAIELPWETTKSIITLAAKRYRRSAADIEKCMTAFERLRPSTAQQILEFHRTRKHTASLRASDRKM